MDFHETQQWWVFTFGVGHPHEGHYVKYFGTYAEARNRMIDKYGLKWAFQYPKTQWDEWLKDPERAKYMETELEEE